jgi:hypothetical protein
VGSPSPDGVVKGRIGQGEDVVGFADLPKNAQGRYEYESEFEIIAPARSSLNRGNRFSVQWGGDRCTPDALRAHSPPIVRIPGGNRCAFR